jgi:DNA-binding protein YbaB
VDVTIKGKMADPLSISASAAGLMSLAITACRCLATYYASWKNYEKDVEKMCQHLEIVSNNMRHLQRCLDEHEFSAALKQQVEAAILACHREIKTLDTELVLIKKTEPPEDRQEKLKSLVRRATYPFKEGTLKKIQDSVIRIQTMLDSVVSILGL